MFNLFLLLNFASIIAFVTGLINPKLVLRGDNRTRRKSSEIYLSAFVLSFIGMCVFVPKPEPAVVVVPAAKLKNKAAIASLREALPTPATIPTPTPTQEAKATPETTPTPSPKQEAKATPETTSSPTSTSIVFNSAVCKTGDYLPVNGASIALYTTCQYLNTDLLKLDAVAAVTGANDSDDPSVLELQSESGFERVMSRNYSLAPESKRDVCVEYIDKSVSCFAFSDPNQTAGVQIQPQETANIPSGSKCEDFATQADAQAALPSNPQLDRDGDGTACDSLASGSGGSRHTGSHRRKR